MAVFDDTQPWETKLMLYSHKVTLTDQSHYTEKMPGVSVVLKEQEPLQIECSHFINCVKTRAVPLTDGQEGLNVLRVLDKLQQSLNQRESIKVFEKLEVVNG